METDQSLFKKNDEIDIQKLDEEIMKLDLNEFEWELLDDPEPMSEEARANIVQKYYQDINPLILKRLALGGNESIRFAAETALKELQKELEIKTNINYENRGLKTMNNKVYVMIQNNDQQKQMLDYLKEKNYCLLFEEDTLLTPDDHVMILTPDDKWAECEPAQKVLEDSEKFIISTERFLNQSILYQIKEGSIVVNALYDFSYEKPSNPYIGSIREELREGDYIELHHDGSVDSFCIMDAERAEDYEATRYPVIFGGSVESYSQIRDMIISGHLEKADPQKFEQELAKRDEQIRESIKTYDIYLEGDLKEIEAEFNKEMQNYIDQKLEYKVWVNLPVDDASPMCMTHKEVMDLNNRSTLKCRSIFREFLDYQEIDYDDLLENLEVSLEPEIPEDPMPISI